MVPASHVTNDDIPIDQPPTRVSRGSTRGCLPPPQMHPSTDAAVGGIFSLPVGSRR